jgi:chromosome segregation ATPase
MMNDEWQMDLLKELFPQIVHDGSHGQPPTAPSAERYFELRFNAGEDRYNRMKGLVRAAMEKVRCIEKENKDLRMAGSLCRLSLQPLHYNTLLSVFVGERVNDEDALKSSVEALVLELDKVRGENARLKDINQTLRGAENRSVIHYEDPWLKARYMEAIAQANEFKPTISKLQAQITAMEFDWTQANNLRDELFDFDDKLREHEMVAEQMCIKRVSTEGVKVFATSRRHMLEILVEDRNRNINGYFMRRVPPLEQLRAQKDAEILELRKVVRRYEVQFGIISVELVCEKLPVMLEGVCMAEGRLHSLATQCADLELKLAALQDTVKHFEDRVREWKTAHEQASVTIEKAERMRSEYDGMVASLRKEESRILAKKKEVEKRADINGRFNQMRDIEKEVDEVEGEIALTDHELKQLNGVLEMKKRKVVEEKKKIDDLELELKSVAVRRDELQMEAALSAEFADVRV